MTDAMKEQQIEQMASATEQVKDLVPTSTVVNPGKMKISGRDLLTGAGLAVLASLVPVLGAALAAWKFSWIVVAQTGGGALLAWIAVKLNTATQVITTFKKDKS